jgi:Flp pilus assembly protein TadB
VSLVVLLILAIVWAAFLVPQIVRHRAERTPADSVGAFRNQLSVLERATPAIGGVRRPATSSMAQRTMSRATRAEARRRRQAILVRLLGAMAFTFVLGLVVRPVLYLHVLLDVLFLSYCALLWRAQALATERDMKVRYLPGPVQQHQPAQLLLQQSGS